MSLPVDSYLECSQVENDIFYSWPCLYDTHMPLHVALKTSLAGYLKTAFRHRCPAGSSGGPAATMSMLRVSWDSSRSDGRVQLMSMTIASLEFLPFIVGMV